MTRGQYAILLDQVNNLLHHSILALISEGGQCDKAPDIFVNSVPGATTLGVVFHGRLNFRCGHTASGHKKPMKDDSNVYDVGHETADVLATEHRDEARLIADKDKEQTKSILTCFGMDHSSIGPWAWRPHSNISLDCSEICLQGAVSSPRGCIHSRDVRQPSKVSNEVGHPGRKVSAQQILISFSK